jgi:hypothetical protein
MGCDVTAWTHTALGTDRQQDCTHTVAFLGVRTDGGFLDLLTVSLRTKLLIVSEL